MQLGAEARTTLHHIDLKRKLILKVEKVEVAVGANLLVRKELSLSLPPSLGENKWPKLLVLRVLIAHE